MSSNYTFRCNRCETMATDSSRVGVELFSQHHMATMHPLFTREAATKAFALPVVKRRRLSSRSVSMCPSRLVRTLAGVPVDSEAKETPK